MADNMDRLFRLYHRELQQIAYRRLGDRELAADLGDLERWKVGLGANIQSHNYVSGNIRLRGDDGSLSPSTTPFAYIQPGYAVWNSLVEYRINDNWTAALNGNNLFDKKYYQTIGSTDRGNWYGEPRNYMLTLRAAF